MKKYLLCLMVGITLVMACSNEDADGDCYGNWSSENKPVWLQDRVNDIVHKESGVSSYYPLLIMSAYSYVYKRIPMLPFNISEYWVKKLCRILSVIQVPVVR